MMPFPGPKEQKVSGEAGRTAKALRRKTKRHKQREMQDSVDLDGGGFGVSTTSKQIT